MDYQRNKTTTILSGLLAIVLGLILIAMPGIAIATVVLLFSVYLIIYGIIRIYDSFRAPQGASMRLPWLIFGAIALLGGLGLMFYPGISVVLLAYYIGFYAIVIGILELIAGFSIRANVGREILVIVAGILSILFGIYLFFQPHIGITLLVLFWGWYSLIYGIILLVYAFTRKSVTSY